jgi:hypothetical protein
MTPVLEFPDSEVSGRAAATSPERESRQVRGEVVAGAIRAGLAAVGAMPGLLNSGVREGHAAPPPLALVVH